MGKVKLRKEERQGKDVKEETGMSVGDSILVIIIFRVADITHTTRRKGWTK